MGYYYLNSRYYNPLLRRFIEMDDVEYLDPSSMNGLNLYCYCMNNPINYYDPSGHFIHWVIQVLVAVTINIVIDLAIKTFVESKAAAKDYEANVKYLDITEDRIKIDDSKKSIML